MKNGASASRASLHQQMGALLAVSVLGFVVLFAISWKVVEKVKVHGVTFEKMAVGKDLVADALPPPSYLLSLHDLAQKMLYASGLPDGASGSAANAHTLMSDYEKRHAFWAASDLPPVLLAKERSAYAAGSAFSTLFRTRFSAALNAGEREEAERLWRTELEPAFELHRARVLELVKEARNYNALISSEAKAEEDNGKLLLGGVVACFSILVVTWGAVLSRRLDEQKRQKVRERESEERYRFALEAANMGTWEWDIASGAVRWAGGVEAMFGLLPGQFKGTYSAYLDLIHPEDRPGVEQAISAALSGETPYFQVEHRVVFREGSTHWLEGKGRVFSDGGARVLMRGTVADITLRKGLEAERASLESMLKQSQRMEAMGKLAGGVAHDFNNILTSIMGGAELALLGTENPSIRALLEEVVQSADRAAGLTRQLLAFSRKQVWQPEILDVRDVVHTLRGMLERLLGPNIRLQVEPGTEPCRVKADRGQLEQVLLNLVVNARDAMPNGGEIRIRCGHMERAEVQASWGSVVGDGEVVVLSVADEGSGISPEVRANLFQPYFTTKVEGKGTGLGLSTVYGVVQQSGGAIELDTELGKGSVFRICLPAVEAGAAPALVERAKARAFGLQGSILVADDETAISKVVKLGLERQGFKVLLAADAEAAAYELRHHDGDLDLLLTDILMPGKSGRALAEEATALRPGIKIVFMSGFAPDDTMQDVIERLGAGLIHKPFSLEALSKHVAAALRGERLEPAAMGTAALAAARWEATSA